jgi:hypothetical protein
MTEDEQKRLEEIEKRYSILPDEIVWLEVDVPLMVRDPATNKMVRHPNQRVTQRRMDLIDKNDPFKHPWAHFHAYPDHANYNKDWREHGECIIHFKSDLKFLKDLVLKLEGKNV